MLSRAGEGPDDVGHTAPANARLRAEEGVLEGGRLVSDRAIAASTRDPEVCPHGEPRSTETHHDLRPVRCTAALITMADCRVRLP